MREVNKVIQIEENSVVNKIVTKEEVISFTSDSKQNLLSVSVEMKAEDDTIVKSETFYFSGKEFIKNPTDNDLWELIDNHRDKGV